MVELIYHPREFDARNLHFLSGILLIHLRIKFTVGPTRVSMALRKLKAQHDKVMLSPTSLNFHI